MLKPFVSIFFVAQHQIKQTKLDYEASSLEPHFPVVKLAWRDHNSSNSNSNGLFLVRDRGRSFLLLVYIQALVRSRFLIQLF